MIRNYIRSYIALAAFGLGLLAATASGAAAADSDTGWLEYGNTVNGYRHSPLTGLTPASLFKVVPAWSKQLGPPVSMEGTPIVRGNTMYVTTGAGAIFALDATTGDTKWSYQYENKDQGKPCCGKDSRGAMLAGDLIVMPTLDAHLIALDAKTGAVRWSKAIVNWADGYAITSPPIFVDGLIISGMAGGEFPTRGFLVALSPKDGHEVWRTYTVPKLTDPEAASWNMAPNKTPHGGPTWIPGTYDKELDLVYWGVGNPNPDFDPSAFAGTQLLYTDSVLAIDPHNGKIKWHYKWTPRDFFDYDGVNENVLVDLPMNGKIVKALAHADRDGYMFVLNRANGNVIYVEPFVDHVTWAKIDRTTGVVHASPEIAAAAAKGDDVPFAPASLGGKNWQPTAYDPATHIFVIPAQEATGVLHPTKTPDVPDEGVANTGKFSTTTSYAGSLVAFDLTTGKKLWKVHTVEGQAGGVMIANGIVYDSEIQGYIQALDLKTGAFLWKTPKIGNGGITAPPITYSVDGTQYLAVEVGAGGLWPRIAAKEAYMKEVKPDSAIYVFKLPR